MTCANLGVMELHDSREFVGNLARSRFRHVPSASRKSRGAAEQPDDAALTFDDLGNCERENSERAWRQAGWKIAGSGEAAERRGVKQTTLTSPLKALGFPGTPRSLQIQGLDRKCEQADRRFEEQIGLRLRAKMS